MNSQIFDNLVRPERIWLHRISYEMEISYPLLSRGFLTIGYSNWSSPNFIDDVRGENGWAKNDEMFFKIMGRYPRNRFYLWNFLVDMEVGDWVIVPSWGTFSIYRITTKARSFHDPELLTTDKMNGLENWHNVAVSLVNGVLIPNSDQESGENAGYDLGFYIGVEPVMTEISRYEYADAPLTSVMKYRGSTKECTEHWGSVEAAIKAAISKQPINLHSQILEASQNAILKLLQSQLNPDKLEALVRWYFTSLGASQVTTPSKNESGKEGDGDIIATFDPLRTIYYVQAKHHAGYTNLRGAA